MRTFFLTLTVVVLAQASLAAPPALVRSDPANGADNIDPEIGVLRFHFDQDMDTGAFTVWGSDRGDLPPFKGDDAAHWVDARTFEIRIGRLEAGKTYALQLNSDRRQRFRSAEGEPLPVTPFVFRTGTPLPTPMPSALAALGPEYTDTRSLVEIGRAAKAGDIRAMTVLGWRLNFGVGADWDPERAAEWYEKAAAAGDTVAKRRLGELCWMGLGVEEDGARCIRLLKEAAEAGDPTAMAELGAAFSGGVAGDLDPDAPREWFKRASKAGSAYGTYRLALLHQESGSSPRIVEALFAKVVRQVKDSTSPPEIHDITCAARACFDFLVPPDPKLGLKLARAAKDTGDPEGTNLYGWLLWTGRAGTRDDEEAVRCFAYAADRGSPDAMNSLGNALRDGRGVAERDYETAFAWYQRAAEWGNSFAMQSLGLCYRTGLGVEADKEKAFEWYRKAADAGNVDVLVDIGACYWEGIGTPQSDEKAISYFRKAMEAGVAGGATWLAFAYQEGRGVEQDYTEAIRLYRIAVQAGSGNAMAGLGNAYWNGQGVEQDYGRAVEWYRKAIEAGYLRAHVFLGNAYLWGYGVEADSATAIAHYRKAAEAGDQEAVEKLKELGFE